MSPCSSHQRSNCHTLKIKNKETQIKSKYASVMKLPNLILHDVLGFEGKNPNWKTLPTHSQQKKQTRLQSETHWQILLCINFHYYLKLTIQIVSNSFCYQISWPIAFLITKNSCKNNGPICRFRVCRLTSTRDPRAARETDLKTSLTWGIHLPLKTQR